MDDIEKHNMCDKQGGSSALLQEKMSYNIIKKEQKSDKPIYSLNHIDHDMIGKYFLISEFLHSKETIAFLENEDIKYEKNKQNVNNDMIMFLVEKYKNNKEILSYLNKRYGVNVTFVEKETKVFKTKDITITMGFC
jgi:hypothetical protein